MTRQLEAAEVERERAVVLLGKHFNPASNAAVGPKTPSAIHNNNNTPATRASSTRASSNPSSTKKRQGQQQRHSRHKSGSPKEATQADAWASGSRHFPPATVSGKPGRRDNVRGVGGKGGTSHSRSRSDALQEERLREVVDERTLRCLHPWVVALLNTSGIQFVPSVPAKNRYTTSYRAIVPR